MAKIEISVPGERILDEFTALVPQPTVPSTARAPDVGLVELTYMNPTELVPGPPGPPGPRGSRWTTGVGAPVTPGGVLGDQYLDSVTGIVWSWDGTQWVQSAVDLTGPQGSPDTPAQVLAKIVTVDGTGSNLDADLLDGQSGAYYLDYGNATNKPSTFPPSAHVHPESDVTNLVSDLAAKAPLASPLFTGDPRAPTPVSTDNDTSIATTAFVKTNIGAVNQFPEAPIDGLTYGRKNALWATIVGGAVVSDNAPAGPNQNGQFWFKSNSGDTYIYVDDGNSQQWVQQNVLPATGQFPVATADTRNRLTNPGCTISQENGTAVVNVHMAYAADQWALLMSGIVATLQSFPLSTSFKGSGYLGFNITTAKPALAATDYTFILQFVEGSVLRDLMWGTASAIPVVVRFTIWTNAPGTYAFVVRNGDSTRSYVVPVTVDGTYTEKTIAIPGCTDGVWPTDTSRAMQFGIQGVCGTTYQTTPNTWVATNSMGFAGMSNLAAASGNLIRVGRFGMYLDPQNTGVAPAWQMPDEAEELRACQRYFQYLYNIASFTPTTGLSYYACAPLSVAMRGTPTVTGVNQTASNFGTTVGTLAAVPYGNNFSIRELRAANATATSGVFATLYTAISRM